MHRGPRINPVLPVSRAPDRSRVTSNRFHAPRRGSCRPTTTPQIPTLDAQYHTAHPHAPPIPQYHTSLAPLLRWQSLPFDVNRKEAESRWVSMAPRRHITVQHNQLKLQSQPQQEPPPFRPRSSSCLAPPYTPFCRLRPDRCMSSPLRPLSRPKSSPSRDVVTTDDNACLLVHVCLCMLACACFYHLKIDVDLAAQLPSRNPRTSAVGHCDPRACAVRANGLGPADVRAGVIGT